jgi:predicted metal-dependent phosphoesterase TrpH
VSLRSTGSIDLHLHTTVSDGRCTPREVVERAARGGVAVMAVTDHDTTAAVAEVREFARACGIHTITGLEITAVDDERDIHVLGYLFNPDDQGLQSFLATQRAARAARVKAIGGRLKSLNVPIEVGPLLQQAASQRGRSLGRPEIARAMMAAGHVSSVQEAFDRFLAHGQPGFVPREGASPETVIGVIHAAGGIASLAHPGKLALEARLRVLAEAGLDAVEVYHPDHDQVLRKQYQGLAWTLGLLMTGGSDFHGDPAHGREPGSVSLPPPEYERLCEARPDACR